MVRLLTTATQRDMVVPQAHPRPPSPTAVMSRLDTLVNVWGATFVRMVIYKTNAPDADASSDISPGSQHLQVRAC